MKTPEQLWEDKARAVQKHESNSLKDSYTAHIAEDYLNGIHDFKSRLRERIEEDVRISKNIKNLFQEIINSVTPKE